MRSVMLLCRTENRGLAFRAMIVLRLFAAASLACVVLAIGLLWFLQAPVEWKPAGALRTPDERFANIQGFPFRPNYADIAGYRIHYVDEGPRQGPVILLLHGVPAWSYSYREMIPQFADEGYRVIAPDFVGFGKSDKPAQAKDYSYQMQIDVLSELVEELDLNEITLFGQDWGGMIGLRVAAAMPDRFARLIAANTSLPAQSGLGGWAGYPSFRAQLWRAEPVELDDLQKRWTIHSFAAYATSTSEFDSAQVMQLGTRRELSPEVLAAYAAPFPAEQYRAGPRAMPTLVVSQLRQNAVAWAETFERWDKPFLTAFSEHGNVTKGGEALFQAVVPGAAGQPHEIVIDAGHFLQEDQPDQLVDIILDFIELE